MNSTCPFSDSTGKPPVAHGLSSPPAKGIMVVLGKCRDSTGEAMRLHRWWQHGRRGTREAAVAVRVARQSGNGVVRGEKMVGALASGGQGDLTKLNKGIGVSRPRVSNPRTLCAF